MKLTKNIFIHTKNYICSPCDIWIVHGKVSALLMKTMLGQQLDPDDSPLYGILSAAIDDVTSHVGKMSDTSCRNETWFSPKEQCVSVIQTM